MGHPRDVGVGRRVDSGDTTSCPRESPSMTRVCVVIKTLARGGAEQLLASSARYFDRERFDYEVAYLVTSANALASDLMASGIRVTPLDGERGIGWVTRLRRLVIDRRVDVVHVHSPYPAVMTRIALPRKVPIVYTEHNVWASYHAMTRIGNALTFHRNAYVTTVSDEVLASIRVPWISWGRPPIETVRQGLDFEGPLLAPQPDGLRAELGVPEDARLIGMVANFKAQKDHRSLLAAMPEVLDAIPSSRLVLVGHGPLEAEIREEISRRRLDGSVVIAGYRADIPRLLAALDVFVLSSSFEGLPIALLEAMALGTPSVVTGVGGVPEVVRDGREAVVVPPRDPRALASGIVAVLQDDDLRRRLGVAARERARVFDIRSAVRRTEEIYAEVSR